MHRDGFAIVCVGLALCLSAFGCGRSITTSAVAVEAPLSYQYLQAISSAYLQATNKLNRGPRNSTELMPYLKNIPNPKDVFTSAEDGEEFVIHWGVDYRTYLGKPQPVLAYEKSGKNGRRYVLRIRDIDVRTNEEFTSLPFPPGNKAP